MTEDNMQEEQPLDKGSKSAVQKSENEASSKKEASTQKKPGKMFFNISDLLAKFKAGIKVPFADSEPAGEIKKPAILMPSAFNAQKINLKSVNQALVIMLAGLAMLMIYVTFRKKPEISSVMTAVSKIKFPQTQPNEVTPFNEISYYLDQIKTRDIFSAFTEKKVPPPVVKPVEPKKPPPPKITIESKAKNLELIGISWGNNPKAIIKDRSDQSVHFVREGETIQGTTLQVKEILKDEVIIVSEGEEMSML